MAIGKHQLGGETVAYSEYLMRQTVEASRAAIGRDGLLPFASIIVRDGQIVGRGLNHAGAHHDPTSHGEVEAIRDACVNLATVDLSDCELYTSAEPCALCVAAMVLTRIPSYYYGASLDEAEAAMALAELPTGVDPYHLRSEAGSSVASRIMAGQQAMEADAAEIIKEWAAAARVDKGAL